MLIPNRHESSDKYRYGFQGQEKDDEVKGEGNSYTAEYWQYDSRLGKRWNIDPVSKPHESRYATFANNPMWFIDPMGRDTLSVTGKKGSRVLFIHDDLEKHNVDLPFKLDLQEDLVIDFNKKGDGNLPDVLGYSFSLSISGTGSGKADSASVSGNYIFFTKGRYEYNPFSYDVLGAKAGYDLNAYDADASITGTFSPFFARKKNADISFLTPESWTGFFIEGSAGASGFMGYGGGFSVTEFMTPGVNNGGKGYVGTSFDFSIGLGAGSDGGAAISAPIMTGGSYYMLKEHFPEPTFKLLNSKIGAARIYAKWGEFISGGMIPGTTISDGLKLLQHAF